MEAGLADVTERTRCEVPQGELTLERYPLREREQLRAFDGADLLALEHVAELGIRPLRAAVIGDEWGSITAGLVAGGVPEVLHIGDSFVAQCAARSNLARNGLSAEHVRFHAATSMPAGPVDLLVVKIPRALSTLDEWLRSVRPSLGADSVVISTAMTKHLHTSTLGVLAARLGRTTTTLAKRKARLALSEVAAPIDPVTQWPRRWTLPLGPDGSGPTIVGFVNAFAAESLDAGTELLLSALAAHRGPAPAKVVDLGCGSGTVGLTVAWCDPAAEIDFVDESFDAVASAEAGWRSTFADRGGVRFLVGDCLDSVAAGEGVAFGSVDRVVVNPPFHVGHALSDATAWDMFVQARRALRRGGDLWVVGNRHLGYHVKLKRVFGNAEVMASSPGFVVLRSVRR